MNHEEEKIYFSVLKETEEVLSLDSEKYSMESEIDSEIFRVVERELRRERETF